MEKKLQDLHKEIVSKYPKLALKMFHEFATGYKKFQGKSGIANILASSDSLYELEEDKYDNEYTRFRLEEKKSAKKIARLQNVPRRGIKTSSLKSKNFLEIMNDLCDKELSYKI
ncbi:MAG: hypothetical protein HC831_02200 [Chloroflexia bacterium]|nr:hypothetical protein [Chloroflexia bacterium]